MTQPPATPPEPGPHRGLAWLNAAGRPAVLAALRRVCASRAWAERLAAARPFPDAAALLAANEAATAALDPAALAEALAAHPPIGRPEPGDPASAREQRGMADAPEALRAEMTDLNLAYQERFGHVFLICATGLSGERMRDALRARMANPPEAEREVVRAELAKINALRLTRLADSAATVSTHVLDTAAGRPAAGVAVSLAVAVEGAAPGPGGGPAWIAHAAARTDADGRCAGLPPLPGGAGLARLTFATGAHLAPGREAPPAFFPEAAVSFAVVPGEHYHVPLLLSPYGYSVYRGS
ncbi:2-oxo-4-hydroxy-4-carboxy-5-ureidoimidazoline decarboxylase [Streptomyces sp. DSM 44917]|uniref:2-oxo-4-hydroxy-4-carboxy-5-ureidoimidazoline decarboxylase n=1 Tax=Streptomyces boetiae TaxID=3075541 RepID=A0ABU2L2H0_9ACTN|nr:2-oxo-4-hydroxy-4-carboxy-5-ureidoimidazoline decarboxylase [Streptomyces sp. DSM 44917]MDT0305761.1 2-oxo-4-hydroxy-4-carboxy-5-ureidoimidazoline decarboxylase [Streptomyces sp. DSM 44917]